MPCLRGLGDLGGEMSALNRLVVAPLRAVPAGLLWRFARRYVAGVTLAEAAAVVGSLNARGMLATLDILGEHVTTPAEARADGQAYLDTLRTIQRQGLRCNISVKPTHMGLKLDRDLCLEILRGLAREADRLGNFMRLDMEDSTCTDDTLVLYRALRRESPAVGVVLQAYLRRSLEDARRLARERANVRVCKGIYVEPAGIAFKEREAIRQNFLALLEILFAGGGYVGIATHDEWVVREARQLIGRLGLPRDGYEFQMLLGVRPDLGERLRADGERLRIYVPFGEKWRAYCLRRFRENPQILAHVLRALLAS
jgi:proline dehydrogenase